MNTAVAQKHIDKNVVYDAASKLMASGGKTSSLDVKLYLRGEGYFAKQQPISALLQELQVEKGWVKNQASANGVDYTEYSIMAGAQNQAPAKTNLTNDIIALVIETANLDPDDEGDAAWIIETSTVNDMGLDHLDLIQIALEIDKKYSIETAKLDWSSIKTIKDMVDLVEKLSPQGVNYMHVGTPVVAPPVVTTNSNITVRKKRQVINDSVNPSSNPRVTINIDAKEHPVDLLQAKTKYADAIIDAQDWFVHQVNGTTHGAVYDKKYSSDNVRTVYARLTKTPMKDVRARRIIRL
jgi:acyl carrier protein